MSYPKQSEVELPLLKLLHELGGKTAPKQIYPRLTTNFPQLTEEELKARMVSSPATFRWHNLVQWTRQKLIENGDVDGSTRGVWKLTAKGRARATGAEGHSTEELLLAHQATLKDLVNENESEIKGRIISELQGLGSTDFRTVLRFLPWAVGLRTTARNQTWARSRVGRLRPFPPRGSLNSLRLSSQTLAPKLGQPAGDRQISRRHPRRLRPWCVLNNRSLHI